MSVLTHCHLAIISVRVRSLSLSLLSLSMFLRYHQAAREGMELSSLSHGSGTLSGAGWCEEVEGGVDVYWFFPIFASRSFRSLRWSDRDAGSHESGVENPN